MSLRCGRWVQIILASGLGLVQCENLNRGRAIGPCDTVDAVDTDEGAMSGAEVAATLCAGEDGLQTVQWQSNPKAMTYATRQFCDVQPVIMMAIFVFFEKRMFDFASFTFKARQARGKHCNSDETCSHLVVSYPLITPNHLVTSHQCTTFPS